ncbi:group 1 glycosyl transferase [Salinisphaera sp. PC39]|uniref:glycosyltransferase family 4 protein n=1 Tax=Salinisphaera sp. PC39 TaxID=1304156 RepID=UPI00333FC694
MKLLHRINLNVSGGVENQFRAFVAHDAARRGMTHDVLVGDPVHPDLSADIVDRTGAVYSYKQWRGFKLPRRPRICRDRNLDRIVRVSGADALLAWSAFAKPALANACRGHGLPLIYREGGAAWGGANPDSARVFLDEVSGAVCNTNASRRMLELKWGYRGPSRICLGGIRPDALLPSPKPRKPRETTILGCASRLVSIKGTALAIHALAVLREQGVSAVLRVAGGGPDRADLEALATRLGVSEHVAFLGPQRDMAAFYRDIDIFLHPALREPLGNVCIEAAANGCIVIAGRVDGLAETVEHDVTGITLPQTLDLDRYHRLGGRLSGLPDLVYDPDSDSLRELRCLDPDDLARAVADLLADPDRYARLSAAAIDRTRNRFRFDRYVEEMVRAIHTFAGIGA